ncbi:MAG: hypothetical protein CL835_03695 [Crocinitomicaceae bacterium]|nr:hypothetical protein [Crocinitomicaceae bacterium]
MPRGVVRACSCLKGRRRVCLRLHVWQAGRTNFSSVCCTFEFEIRSRFLMNLQDLVGQIKSQPRLLIRFHASWCGVCKLLAPHVESLKQNDAYADVTFVDVDVEENLDVKEAFKINDLPYFAGFKDGKLLEEFATAKKDRVTELTDAVAS